MMKFSNCVLILFALLGSEIASRTDANPSVQKEALPNNAKSPEWTRNQPLGSESWRELHEKIFGQPEEKVDPQKVLSDLNELNNLYNELKSSVHDTRHNIIKRLLSYATPSECSSKTFENYIKEKESYDRFGNTVGSYLDWALNRDLGLCLGSFEREILFRYDAKHSAANQDEAGENKLNMLLAEVKKLLTPKQVLLYSLNELDSNLIITGLLNHLKAISTANERTLLEKKNLQGKQGKKEFTDLFELQILTPCVEFWNVMLEPLLAMKYYAINEDTKAILKNKLADSVRDIVAKMQICRPIMKNFNGFVKKTLNLALYPEGKPSTFDRLKKTTGKLMVPLRKHQTKS